MATTAAMAMTTEDADGEGTGGTTEMGAASSGPSLGVQIAAIVIGVVVGGIAIFTSAMVFVCVFFCICYGDQK